MAWTAEDLPDLAGRTAVVTGANSGIGLHVARALAARGARVVLAGRNLEATRAAATSITSRGARAEAAELDLASMASVRAFTESWDGPLDLLVNNAGVMGVKRWRTADDLDLTLATNHFGPFLLTGLLLPQLVASGAGTVVTVSSIYHRYAGGAPLGDPTRPSRGLYRKWRVYGRSKLANLLFTSELDRRCRQDGVPVRALAAHPGFAGTHLAANGQYGRSSGGIASILDAAIRVVSQPAAHGAWPTLMAATADLPGSSYVGPSGPGEFGGTPQVTTGNRASRDADDARALWELSERTTGIAYP